MILTVLGSGSRGNAFAISSRGVTLLLDAGFGPKVLARRARQVGIDFDSIIGILLTHEHGDHSRGAGPLSRRFGCPIYASRGTLTALTKRLGGAPRREIRAHQPLRIGPFQIEACRTSHDAAEPLAFTIRADGATLGCAYDIGRPTAALRYLLRDATALLLEANHDEVMLRVGPYPPSVRDRIAGAGGHLSNRAAGQLLSELCHRRLHTVILVHLSDRCNREDIARDEVERAVSGRAFRGALLVASQEEPLEVMRLAPEVDQLDLGLAG